MLIVNTFKCPYCKRVYAKEYAAEECARECVDVERVINDVGYVCEMCNTRYEEELDAVNCEKNHEASDDKYFFGYCEKKNFEALKKASEVIGQRKLGGE